jgi:hypothetical protein
MPDTNPSPVDAPTVSQINNLLGVNLYDVLSFRADVAIDFDEYGRVLKTELLNPAARTSIGPDSERIREAEQVIADALTEVWTTDQHEHWPEYIATALRAAGLLPGPDDIVVSREALKTVLGEQQLHPYGDEADCPECSARATLRAALSQPHPAQEQQT